MRLTIGLIIVVLVVLGIGYWRYQQPLPTVRAEVNIPKPAVGTAIKLPWPNYGQSAFGVVGFGVLDKNNTSKPVPIASIAKAVAALAIVKEKPLKLSNQGPNITLTEADVQLFNEYFAKDGSVLPVIAGQQISQYQALQAMLLPSANNIADTTVSWAFGSVDAYAIYANNFVKSIGMAQTTVADASGFSPNTVSTAEDLVILGDAVLKTPVLAEIVNQTSANLPTAGPITNVNWLLGTDGILGIKTGNTDEAGGCYLFGAKRSVDGQTVTVIGAILGAPTRNVAMEDSRVIIQAADKGFETVTAVKDKQVVGSYTLPWGSNVEAVASGELKALNWKGKALVIDTNLSDLKVPKDQNAMIGSVKAGSEAKSVSAVLKQSASSPSWIWRIFR